MKKKLVITIIISSIVCVLSIGLTWYFMDKNTKDQKVDLDKKIEELQQKLNNLTNNSASSEDKQDDTSIIVGFNPNGLFTEEEKKEIKSKITDPYIYYSYNVETDSPRSIVSITVKEYSEDERPAGYYYGIDVVDTEGYRGGWLFGQGGAIDYWKAECMDECLLTQDFIDKYPNNFIEPYKLK